MTVKMRKCILLLITTMMPLFLFAQSYAALWKKAAEADEKDQPKTEYDILQKIVKKASKDKAYGHLLKAELKAAQCMSMIAPDSLKPAVLKMKERCDAATDEVLKTVYQTVIYKICADNGGLDVGIQKPELTMELCAKLAAVKEKKFEPFIIEGRDHDIFDEDLLNIVGHELRQEDRLYDYYAQTGQRRAACILAADKFQYSSQETIDSLIKKYEDVPEVGELVISRYHSMRNDDEGTRVAYIHEALAKYGGWKRMDYLRNELKRLTNSEISLSIDASKVMPQQDQTVRLYNLRNIHTVTMKVYKVNARGDIRVAPDYDEGYMKIKPLLGEVVQQEVKTFTGKEPYERFDGRMTLKGLPAGVYLVEFSTEPSTNTIRRMYFVTDVYTLAQGMAGDESVRYVVVSAKSGQPIAGARLEIREHIKYNEYKDYQGITDEKGEFILNTKHPDHSRDVFAYTDTDQGCPLLTGNNSYSFYGHVGSGTRSCIYTDRAIYRPGQTVHASVLVYHVENGIEHRVAEALPVEFKLYDANGKVVGRRNVETDEYGVCATEFSLPASGLTGRYRIEAANERIYFNVEEYKRPTFHVDFPEVKEAYGAGDTLNIKATAMSYAGVPVQEARVRYKVERRTAFWWWSYSSYWNTGSLNYGSSGEEVFSSETLTDDQGQFNVELPLSMPETDYPMFYQFVVTADVTDSAGETRSGRLSLPLGNRKQVLNLDLTEQVLKEDQPKATFHLLNAAGQDLDAQVSYRVDGGAWRKARTNTEILINQEMLKSGRHELEGICQGDTVKRSFVFFSLSDQVAPAETDDWFYQSAEQFSNDGSPVIIQVGSSDKDVHIVYSISAGNKLIEQGAVDRSNQLFNLRLTYEEEYGNGLLLTFAWVKNAHCYSHTVHVKRPLPDKKLTLQWATFRDRLVPGQKEEWTLTIKDPTGKPADAQLMAVLYDKSLDQIKTHGWRLVPYFFLPLPSTQWNHSTSSRVSGQGYRTMQTADVYQLVFSKFDEGVFPQYYGFSFRGGRGRVLNESMPVYRSAAEPMLMKETRAVTDEEAIQVNDSKAEASEYDAGEPAEQMEMRENLNETAFFYPQLTTDAEGHVALKFTLPESLTTWRFLGLAHTRDLSYGQIEAETVAQKDIMIQPNVPRFLRDGDEGVIAARIFNTSKKQLTGKAMLKLKDPETDAVVFQQSKPVTLKAGQTAAVTFDYTPDDAHSLLVCQIGVSGTGFSDGEQHYLPILPSSERVTVTLPITQHEPGKKTIDLAAMMPADGTNGKFTFEYTNNPAWLTIQALPVVGTPSDDNAISQAAAFYAQSLGRHILDENPESKKVFDLWRNEASQPGGEEGSLVSQLSKNQELKDIVLNETPWVLDAERETEQKRRLADFFDENLMQQRLGRALEKLTTLQLSDGAWTWWKDMPGSFYMTVAVSNMLVRLNALAGSQEATRQMLKKAFDFMGTAIVDEVKEMKKREKEGFKQSFPSFKALEWLYLATLDGRTLPAEVQKANDYLVELMKKDIKKQTIYEKALSAVVLSKIDPKRAQEYAQSIREYTVYREDLGRYFDTPRAGYSWYDYTIPTQVMAIEALQRLAPDDRQTIEEMQRWILQQKRTQAWDTPINSVNAVYAFLHGGSLKLGEAQAVVNVDGHPLDLPKATAAVGYVKTTVPASSKSLSVEKGSRGTSWGAVYAQFMQKSRNIQDSGNGFTIEREILDANGRKAMRLKVGDRVTVRLTITADNNYDFVQVLDKRAACMEPVKQLSGYHSGSYCTPKDNSTSYYFDIFSKGTHVIENVYVIDRVGTYETGSCTVGCAYSPEFRATTKSQTLIITE